MCRLFLSISTSNNKSKMDLLRDLIEKYLYKGTVVDKMYDGYGFAWKRRISSQKWNVYKSHKPYFCDIKSQYVINHLPHNEVIIGHIRSDQPQRTRVVAAPSMDNTHPFYYKNRIFEHNGFIRNFGQHRNFLKTCILPKFSHLIRGNTDTELLFYLLLSFLESAAGDEKRALQNMFGFFRRNGITGLFNMIYGAPNVVIVSRYSLDEGTPIPLYIAGSGSDILISTMKITPDQKMMGKNEILVFRTDA